MDFRLSEDETAVVWAVDDVARSADPWAALVAGGWLDAARDSLPLAALVGERLGVAGLALPFIGSGVVFPLLFGGHPHPGRVGVTMDGWCEDGIGSDAVVVLTGSSASLHEAATFEPIAASDDDGLAAVGTISHAVVTIDDGDRVQRVRHAATAVAASELAGLLRHLAAMTAAYVQQREQFGRPLSAFQAVRHSVVRLHGTAEAATWLSRTAVETLDELQVAAAKGWISNAAQEASALAYQLHGAIGFTREYPLQATTKRLRQLRFAWGDERLLLQRVGELRRGTAGPPA